MENKQNNGQQSQPGTGSAENTGRDREEQMHKKTDLSENERKDIASEIGEDPDKIASIRDTGAMSGRDDASGGTADRMEQQSTGEATDR
jgi:hypothetical protein